MENLHTILSQAKQDIQASTSTIDLENLHIRFLGRNGLINQALQEMKNIPPEQRKDFGQQLNSIKNEIIDLFSHRQNELLQKEESEQYVDITLPGTHYPKGSLHMVTLAIEEISSIFEKLGFIRMSYPEVEWEYFAFDALNMSPNHPARDDFETFFIDAEPHHEHGKMILTPHTSSGQNREMRRLSKPPIRMINIAKTYRPNWDASHTPMFHQFEGVCIDKNINITHLKGTINHFAKEFFGEERKTRLRPYHFQFTEPSFEVDITCGVCNGTGMVNNNKCKLCKQGWLELGGAGMVHPNVLKAGGINPEEYTGWAFGIGVERTFMMKEGLKLDDLRIMYSNNIRFLEQF